MTIATRNATPADTQALREIFLRARRESFTWRPAAEFQLRDFDAQTQGERIWVAQDRDARLMGFVSLWEPDDFIHHLYVDPRWARRGVGRALLHALPGWPATRFRLKCLRLNTAALAFYRACRFREAGTGTSGDGDYLLLESSGAGGFAASGEP